MAEAWTSRRATQLKDQESTKEVADNVARVFDVFDALAPPGPLAGLGCAGNVTQLARLLGIHWLSDTIIDAMAFLLNARITRTPKTRGTVVFASVDLACQLPEVATAQKEISRAAAEVLGPYERMDLNHVRYLLIPINIDNQHWVAVCVDIKTKTW
ncbi:hypothetical protein M407DRAFT_34765 [Tulasnella calospora MUT 4182]|uniref:Ubiquitin-like protease family profile domain-containing protein n=1 Tax=Tulasnella calospora MUT 4182 TaxID=1051891 RepID=A0A0C3Q042_9AGAM|nr:hypothetical protein M407DRAFT_34765 [Tulasnella calospora MUT 4182]